MYYMSRKYSSRIAQTSLEQHVQCQANCCLRDSKQIIFVIVQNNGLHIYNKCITHVYIYIYMYVSVAYLYSSPIAMYRPSAY